MIPLAMGTSTASTLLFATVANGFVVLSAAASTSTSSFAAAAASSVTSVASDALISCRSNSTHIGWIQHDDQDDVDECVFETVEEARSEMTKYLFGNIMPYDVPNAVTLGFDVALLSQLSSLAAGAEVGIDNGGATSPRLMRQQQKRNQNEQQPHQLQHPEQPSIDGLADGVLNQTLHYSLLAKSLYPWTDSIPRSIYLEYVVPYAVVNEPRTDHRALLFDALRDSLKEWERSSQPSQSIHMEVDDAGDGDPPSIQIKKVVKIINTRLWSKLGRNSAPIVFQAGLTPRIFDPLSVVSYGHSSCTGLAILLIAALRAVGIPARMAGTPAWNGEEDRGNHSWLEVFVPNDGMDKNNDEKSSEGGVVGSDTIGGKWIFLEPSPGIAEGDEASANADDLYRDPCKRWFCKPDRFDGKTRVYASRYSKVKTVTAVGDGAASDSGDGGSGGSGHGYTPIPSNTFYKLAWAVGEEGVPGEDRTDYYSSVCGNCG